MKTFSVFILCCIVSSASAALMKPARRIFRDRFHDDLRIDDHFDYLRILDRFDDLPIRNQFPVREADFNKCVTKQGSPGKCLPEFDCPILSGRPNSEKTECKRSNFVKFYCCPSKAPINNGNLLDKLKEPNCGIGPSKGGILASTESRHVFKRKVETEPMFFETTDHPIVGGYEAEEFSWPWMASIYTKEQTGTYFLCGGAIINANYIVSAAHCFKPNKNTKVSPGSFVVRVAEHNVVDTNEGEEYEIEEIILHEEYSPPVDYNDIALIRLKDWIGFYNRVQAICLPLGPEKNQVLDGRISHVIGWGVTSYGGRDSDTLREVSIPVTSTKSCDKAYRSIRAFADYPKGIIDSQLCAGLETGEKDACQGDSGGPLMLRDSQGRWTLIGIVSGGFQCARAGFPGVYTRVTHYLTWMAQNIND